MFKKRRSGLVGAKIPTTVETLLSKEEAEEILNPHIARAVALEVLKKPDFADLSIRDPQAWIGRARHCIEEVRFDYRVAILDYAIYSLSRFLALSPNKDTELVGAAGEVVKELIKEWRRWKPLQEVKTVIIHAEDLPSVELRHCMWLFRIEGYRECIKLVDDRLISPMLRTESAVRTVAIAAVLKAQSLAALGRYGEAAKACRLVYTQPPYDASSCLMAGNLLLGKLSCYEESIECYDMTTTEKKGTEGKDETTAKAWHNKALAYLKLGQLERGRDAFEECKRVAPGGSRSAESAQHALDVLSGHAKPDLVGSDIQFEIM